MTHENYRTIIQSIARTQFSQLQVFSDFCRLVTCSLALGSREEEYRDIATRYSSEHMHDFSKAFGFLVNEMQRNPFTDVLGEFYLEVASHSSKQARGEFFTPSCISKAIAHMLFDPDVIKAKNQPITVNEPACGSGGMVLAIAEMFAPNSVDLLRVTCQDINPVAVDMCFINTSLWGIPAQVILGDTVRMTETGRWKNVRWHRVGEDQRIAFRDLTARIRASSEEKSVTSEPTGPFREVAGQFELDLGCGSEVSLKR